MPEVVESRLDPNLETIFQSALALLQENRRLEAAEKFRSLLAIEPTLAEAWHNLGHACALELLIEAEHAFRTARRLSPSNCEIACSLAVFYAGQERYFEALELFKEVLDLQPDNLTALSGAGHASQNLFQAREAHNYYQKLLQQSPDDIDALNNLGVLYREAGDLHSSRRCFEQILAKSPEEGDARWNLSHSLLISGYLKQGWEEYEWRFCRTASIPLPTIPLPRWNREPLDGKTILLWSEQGYGDTIQFIRFADILNSCGAKVIVVAQDAQIAPLLATAKGVYAVVQRDQPLPQADYWTPLLSLPHLLKVTFETIPVPVPYLSPSSTLLEKWRSRIAGSDVIRIGLVWAGRLRPDPRRTCLPEELLPLLASDVRRLWYSLQVGAPAQFAMLTSALPLTDLSPFLTDFGETAAALCSLDLVITIDTSVAHLAGALGIPVWLLLPFAPDWRWLLERDDSPWYPSMRIFRQPAPGDWGSVIRYAFMALNSACDSVKADAAESSRQTRLLDESDHARGEERWQDALNHCFALLSRYPLYPLALLRAGGCLLFLKQPAAARRLFEKVTASDPVHVDAHINLGLACLTIGDYETGWKEFEWRLRKITDPLPAIPTLPAPGITLENLREATVLVHTEQGFGDILQFVRYLPLLAGFGMRVILSAPPSMFRLLSCLEAEGVRQIIPHGEKLPAADYQTFLMSTPLLLRDILPEPVSRTPYLFPSRDLTELWAERLPPDDNVLRVGLAWAGREMKQSGYRRSLNIQDYVPLLRQPGVTFVSLQLGPRAADISLLEDINIIDLSSEITDFADTAAIIAGLDLVISIDTSVAHLAAALGKPTWVALLHLPDWRWGLDGAESVWYPSMRLFRQHTPGEWEPVIAEMATLLKGEILIRQGHVFAQKEDREKTIQSFLDATELPGDTSAAWLNLGIYLRAFGKMSEARDALLKAVEAGPDYPDAWQNLGLIHQAHRELPEAYTCFRRALALWPDYPTARWNLGLLQLLLGEYREGFKNLESRFDTIAPVARLHQNIPRWDSSLPAGKSILIHSEQGYGDMIQFARFVPLMASSGCTVIFEVQDHSVKKLVSSPGDSIQVIVRGEPIPAVDFQAPLLSLPLLLGTDINNIPDKFPYLFADKHQTELWKNVIARDDRLCVGIAWKGRQTPDPGRSVPFAKLAELFSLPDIAWYSLQMDCDSDAKLPANMIDKTAYICDFSDTAAFISNLDLVVTIDSAVAHLAGALKIPAIIMLQAVPDWRWGLDNETTPWYSSLTLVRQTTPGIWDDVVEEVSRKLTQIKSIKEE